MGCTISFTPCGFSFTIFFKIYLALSVRGGALLPKTFH